MESDLMGYEEGNVDKQIKRFNYRLKSQTQVVSNFPSKRSKYQKNTNPNVTNDLLNILNDSKKNRNNSNKKIKSKKHKSNNKNKIKKNNSNNKSKKNNSIKNKKKHYTYKFSRYHKRSMQPFINANQWDSCNQGLYNDAVRQIKYINNLISKSNNKNQIKYLIDEIERFIRIHNLLDEDLRNKKQGLDKKFKNKFN